MKRQATQVDIQMGGGSQYFTDLSPIGKQGLAILLGLDS